MLRAPRRIAFTLIELLVVIAIISLLMSILLPSLGRAREQGKTAKCVANLKSIGQAMYMYFGDNNNWFPFEKRNDQHTIHGFYYGGHPGRTGWWGYDDMNFRDTPRGRPFNRYMYPGFSLRNDYIADDDEQNRVMPSYECPSDRGAVYNTDGNMDPNATMQTTYWQCGSSYDFNYHFIWRWAIRYVPPGYPQSVRDTWLQRGNAMLRQQMERNSGRFIMLYEDAFDSAMWNNISRRGWHQQWNRHSFLFLDGHAANIVTDTTAGNFGTSWKSLAGLWYLRDTDPDYALRTITAK